MNDRTAIYLRVSTDGQTVENQAQALASLAARKGWTITREFRDEGISGAKGRAHRPAFDAMLTAAAAGDFDRLLVWSLDRLSRSLADLVMTASVLESAGVALLIHEMAIDTSTPMGKLFYQILGSIAEFERAMIRERVISGTRRARAEGKPMGRTAWVSRAGTITKEQYETMDAALWAGLSARTAAAVAGVSPSTAARRAKIITDRIDATIPHGPANQG